MDAKQRLAERKQLFRDTIHFKKTDRVPTVSNSWTWQVIDSDQHITIEQANDDWSLMEKANREHFERYDFDGYISIGTRNCNAVTKALGNGQHMITGNIVNAVDEVMIETDEDFRRFRENPTMYAWEVMGPKRFAGLTFGQIEDAIRELQKSWAYAGKIGNVLAEEYGALMPSCHFALVPLEQYADNYRGLKNFSIDLRRRAKLYDDIVQEQLPAFRAAVDAAVQAPESERHIADIWHGYLGNSVLNHKQFERFYFPFSKYLMDQISAAGKTAFFFWEADCIRFADLFQDYPRGSMLIFPEQEHLFDIRKAFPNAALGGGMPVDLLGKATPQTCVDYAKELLDGLGEGFIMSQNKMMSFEYDCKRENLMAVQEFMHGYRR